MDMEKRRAALRSCGKPLPAIEDGSYIRVTLAPGAEVDGIAAGRILEGDVLHVGGMDFLSIAGTGPVGKVVGPLSELAVETVEVLRSRDEILAERRARRIGEPFLDWTPVDRDGYERALRLLTAESVRLADLRRAAVLAGDEAAGRRLYWRLLQIGEQFGELADGIGLSRRKRRYMQLDARHVAQGGLLGTVDPTEHISDILDGMAVVPPKPKDFHPDPRVRRARPRVDPGSEFVTLGNGAVWRGLAGWSDEAQRLLASSAGMWRLDRHLEALPAAVIAAEKDEGVLRRADEILARGWKGRTARAVVARVERFRRMVADRLDGSDLADPAFGPTVPLG